MRNLAIIAALTLLPALCFSQDFSLFDSAMAQLDMTREDIRFDKDEMAGWGGDKWRLSYFTMFHQNPLKLPKYGQMNLEAYAANCGNITALITDGGRKIDCPVRRGLIGDPLEQYASQGDSVRHASFLDGKIALDGRLRDKLDLFYRIVEDRDFSYVKSFNGVTADHYRSQVFEYFVADSQKHNDLVEELAEKIDFNRMVAGAEDLAEALRRIADSAELGQFPPTRSDIRTPYGLIVVGSKENDTYAFQTPPLLILDPSGNDTYRISGYATDYPLDAIIDLSGNDTYVSEDSTSPGIGGAVLGLSFVIDKAGDDFYSGVNVSQGCGIFGVSAVIDNNGNDRYTSKSNAQGCGIFGIGILSDSTGNDTLYCWANSQGYGYTKGCGLCINYSGDDVYTAQDSILFSPGQQTQEHNSSLAQGTGFGKRADYLDGHSWAGGVGILCDVSGHDKYNAGLFAQGCGYWFAIGMLIDGDGNDIYRSVWYTLGSGAHFAIGYCDDFAGNDIYTATLNMSIGSGHDFTIGYCNDRGGNDIYQSQGLSFGGGNFQGIGIFHDWDGNDVYNTTGNFILGGAQGLNQGARAYLNTFGVFIDGGGIDAYKETWAKDGTRWISPRFDGAKPGQFEIGVGVDR